MSVYRVLDKLEEYVHNGTWLPAGYRILSEEKLIEFVEKVRATLPEEVGRAKIIAKDQDRVMRAAQEKAQAIVEEASVKHGELLDNNEIVQRARATADAIMRDAEERAAKVRDGADHYAAQVLAEMEARLGSALGSVQKGREALTRTKASVATKSASAPAAAAPQAQTTGSMAEAAAKAKRAAFDLQSADETAELESVEA